MASGQDVARYFKMKGEQWTATSGSVENHLRKNGRKGMKAEFLADPQFRVVCTYVEQVGEIQFRSEVLQSLEEMVSDTFGALVVGALDILIGAVVEACGDKPLGDKLVEGAVTTIGISLLIIVIGALFSK